MIVTASGMSGSTLNTIITFDRSSRTFVAAYWPVAGATGAHIRSVYEGIDRQMQAEVENDKPEPFLETAFDRLAPELREQLEEMESRAAPAREV